MNKDTMKDEQLDHEQAATEAEETSTAEMYFFPNDGGVTAFSCRADGLKEAQERNQEHLEQLKKETD